MTKAFAYRQTEIGELTNEGVYIGRLADKNGKKRDYFAAPTDAQDENGERLSLTFNQAAAYAKKATYLDHNDWVVPTSCRDKNGAPDVLNAICYNKGKGAFKDTFDDKTYETAFYWSSSSGLSDSTARVQNLCTRAQHIAGKPFDFYVRLVRSLPA